MVDSIPEGNKSIEIDTVLKEEGLVSQEVISPIVSKFSELYGIPFENEKTDLKIYMIDPEDIDREVADFLFRQYTGIDAPAREQDIKRVMDYHETALGEWLHSKNIGFILSSSEKYGEKGMQHVISHEVVHALASVKKGGFVYGSLYDRIMRGDESVFNPNIRKFNEGVTEILTLGLKVNSTDLDMVKGELIERLLEAKRNPDTLIPYLSEVYNVYNVLQISHISLMQLADYYIKGDYKSFGMRARETIENERPNIDTCSDEEFKEYMSKYDRLSKSLNYLGL